MWEGNSADGAPCATVDRQDDASRRVEKTCLFEKDKGVDKKRGNRCS